MSNKTYDILKIICLIVLPAFTTFVIAIIPVLGVPHSDAIIFVLTAFNTMLGTIITKISSMYNKKIQIESEKSMNQA